MPNVRTHQFCPLPSMGKGKGGSLSCDLCWLPSGWSSSNCYPSAPFAVVSDTVRHLTAPDRPYHATPAMSRQRDRIGCEALQAEMPRRVVIPQHHFPPPPVRLRRCCVREPPRLEARPHVVSWCGQGFCDGWRRHLLPSAGSRDRRFLFCDGVASG